MNVLAIHNTADNGAVITSRVTLLWEEDEPFTMRPFRAEISVNSTRMATSHHTTSADAKAHAEKMHSAYLEVHSAIRSRVASWTRVSVDRYRFFREHAGGIVGERAKGALALARAEALLAEAVDLGIGSVEWVDDEEPYDHGFYSDEQVGQFFDSNQWTGPYGCVVTVGDETTSLWGIVLNSRGTDDPYARVVAAELASELADELRQAIGDTRDRDDFEALLSTLARAGVQTERIDAMRATRAIL